MTTPAEEPFAGKQTDTTCPNCGRELFSGLAEGGILVCRNEDGDGCQIAVDPDNLLGASAAPQSGRIEDVQASPEVGPPNENADSTAGPGYAQASVEEAWEPPTSAPQAANALQEDEAPAPTPAPVAPPATQEKSSTTGSGSSDATETQ